MSLFQQMRDKRIERQVIVEGAGALLTKASKEKRSLTASENLEFERRHKDADRMLIEIGQLEKQLEEEVRGRQIRPDSRTAGREDTDRIGQSRRRGAADSDEREDDRGPTEDERDAFRTWIVGGYGALNDEQRALMPVTPVNSNEIRALSGVTSAAGAATIPQGFSYSLDVALKDFGGIMDVAEEKLTDNGADYPWPSMNDTGNSGEQVAENTGVTTSQDMTFGVTTLKAWMLDSGIVKLPISLFQDSAFDVDTWLTDALGTRVFRKLNTLGTTGAGTTEPKGIVPAATLGVTAGAVATFTYGEIMDLIHSVDPAYRRQKGCGFMFNDTTLKVLKKLVDSNGRPLFRAGGTAEGIQGKAPDRIDDYPLTINQDMASPATGQKTMLFGLLNKFKVRRVKGLQIIRFQERFMDSLQLGFLAFMRADTNLIDAGTHPVKYLVQA